MVSSISEPGTAGCSLLLGRGHLTAAGLGVLDLAGLARQILVQLLLDTAAALAVGVDPAQYPGGQIAVRVHALAAGVGKDSGDDARRLLPVRLLGQRAFEVLDLLPDLGGLAAGQQDVTRPGGPQLLRDHVGVHAEDRGEQRRGLLGRVPRHHRGRRVLDGRGVRRPEHRGVGRDVVRVHAGGERDPAAVRDPAALGREDVLDVPVLFGLGRVRAGVDGLDLEQAYDKGDEDEGEAEADHAQPGAWTAEAQGGGRLDGGGTRAPGAGVRAPGGGGAAVPRGPRGGWDPASRGLPVGHSVTCRRSRARVSPARTWDSAWPWGSRAGSARGSRACPRPRAGAARAATGWRGRWPRRGRRARCRRG